MGRWPKVAAATAATAAMIGFVVWWCVPPAVQVDMARQARDPSTPLFRSLFWSSYPPRSDLPETLARMAYFGTSRRLGP
jgi:hypothetical protein